MEAARHPQYLQPNLDITHKNHPATKRPTKTTKVRTWSSTLPPFTTANLYNKEEGTVMKVDELNNLFITKSVFSRKSLSLHVASACAAKLIKQLNLPIHHEVAALIFKFRDLISF